MKGKAKQNLLNILTTAFVGCLICGIFCIFGTAGASDIERIGVSQAAKQVLQGSLLIAISYAFCFIRNALQ